MINVRLMFAVEMIATERPASTSLRQRARSLAIEELRAADLVTADCEMDVTWPALVPVGSEVGLVPQQSTVEGYDKLLRLRVAGYGWQLLTPTIILCRLDPVQVSFDTLVKCREYLDAIGCKVSE